jgi:Ribbon-helix-helix protein, copG family
MRTTVTLDDDVTAAVEQLRRREHIGVSEAINRMVRLALLADGAPRKPFVQKTYPMGPKIDVSNIADAIEELEGPYWR